MRHQAGHPRLLGTVGLGNACGGSRGKGKGEGRGGTGQSPALTPGRKEGRVFQKPGRPWLPSAAFLEEGTSSPEKHAPKPSP